MHAHGSQWFSHKMTNRHLLQLKKSKSWEPFWSYQLNSTANLANLAQFWGKWAWLAVLFSLLLQNGSQDFHFFNCLGCQIFILCEIHCYLCPHIFWLYYFSLSQCVLWLTSLVFWTLYWKGQQCQNILFIKVKKDSLGWLLSINIYH